MCVGKTVDKLPGATQQPLRNSGSVGNYIPTLGESVDGHYMRTNASAEKRHTDLGVHQEMPDVKSPAAVQDTKTPDRDLGRNRKAFNELNSGTLLTGPSGISKNALTVGKTSLLGG